MKKKPRMFLKLFLRLSIILIFINCLCWWILAFFFFRTWLLLGFTWIFSLWLRFLWCGLFSGTFGSSTAFFGWWWFPFFRFCFTLLLKEEKNIIRYSWIENFPSNLINFFRSSCRTATTFLFGNNFFGIRHR